MHDGSVTPVIDRCAVPGIALGTILGAVLGAFLCGCGADNAGSTAPNGTTASSTGQTGATAGLSATGSASSGDRAWPDRVLVTADWRQKTLSVVDYQALLDGAVSKADIVVSEIDLAQYEPGPIEVELTPDATHALVAVSPGFFDGIVGSTIGSAMCRWAERCCSLIWWQVRSCLNWQPRTYPWASPSCPTDLEPSPQTTDTPTHPAIRCLSLI